MADALIIRVRAPHELAAVAETKLRYRIRVFMQKSAQTEEETTLKSKQTFVF